MKKMIKMSLVAAVAVAGLSSNVSAKSLEDAIKNVEVSGMMRFRFDGENSGADNAATESKNDFDTELMIKSKVTDNTTAVVKVEADKSHSSNDAKASRLNAELSLAYLSTKIGDATVSVGRQGIPGPFDDAQGGDGIIATLPVGPVTLAAAYLTTTSAAAGPDAVELALMGNADAISYDLWHIAVANTVAITSAHVAADVSGVNVDAMYTTGKIEDADDSATLAKIAVSAKAGAVDLSALVAVTGDENSNGVIAIDGDSDAGSDVAGEIISIGGLDSATAVVLGASTMVSDVKLSAGYIFANYDSSIEEDDTATEYNVNAVYKIDSSIALKGIYAAATENDDADTQTFTRIELKYKF